MIDSHQSELFIEGEVRAKEDRDRAEARERDRCRDGARAGLHEHADVVPLMNSDFDESLDDVVDSDVRIVIAMGASFEEEERVVGCDL